LAGHRLGDVLRGVDDSSFRADDEQAWSPAGRVISRAMDEAGDGGTVTEALLVRVWQQTYSRDPTPEERYDLVAYARVIFTAVDSPRR
jgi:hypothetical protein